MREMHKRRTLQELNLADDFLFGKVISDTGLCKLFLEKLLKIEIERIHIVEAQKTVKPIFDNKGVRFDVYVKDEFGTVYEIEMQAAKEPNLPRRARYYQSVIDMDNLEAGASYGDLPKSYVIFVCTEDYFGMGRHVYTFEHMCLEDKSLCFGSGARSIILNTQGTVKDVDDDLLEFLKYLEQSTDEMAASALGTLVPSFHQRVGVVKRDKRTEVEFMTLEEKLERRQKEGYAEGHAEGHSEAQLEVAKNMKNKGIDLTMICECTGLSEDEVGSL